MQAPAEKFPAALLLGPTGSGKTPLGEIQVLNVHLRPQVSDSGSVVSGYFTTDEIRHDQIHAFIEHLDPDLPTLILGDFNENRCASVFVPLDRAGGPGQVRDVDGELESELMLDHRTQLFGIVRRQTEQARYRSMRRNEKADLGPPAGLRPPPPPGPRLRVARLPFTHRALDRPEAAAVEALAATDGLVIPL